MMHLLFICPLLAAAPFGLLEAEAHAGKEEESHGYFY